MQAGAFEPLSAHLFYQLMMNCMELQQRTDTGRRQRAGLARTELLAEKVEVADDEEKYKCDQHDNNDHRVFGVRFGSVSNIIRSLSRPEPLSRP
jgi:hypothetical protein